MKTAFIILAIAVAGALADGFGSHRHSGHRQGRRLSSRRPAGRQGRNRAFRRGRQEELEAAPPTYAAAAEPVDSYGASAQEEYVAETTAAPAVYDDYEYPEEPVPTYEAEAPIGAYGASDEAADPNLAMLEKAVPGIPGEDYPINAEVPETAFSCDGQVDGGYYADPEAQCQVFHICTADGQGGLAKYSFLCPNGTIFNQNYFICDWWFNFDCSEAEGLYSLNDDIAAERAALAGGEEEPTDAYGAAPAADYEYPVEDYEYPVEEVAADAPVPTYEAETEAPLDVYAADETAVLPTAIPTYEEQERAARNRFSGRRGGRNGRRNNRGRNGRRNNSRGRSNGRRQGRNQRNQRRQGRRNNFRG